MKTDEALFMRGLLTVIAVVALFGMTAMIVYLAVKNPGVNPLIGNLLATIVGALIMLLKDSWGWWFNSSKRMLDEDRELRTRQ